MQTARRCVGERHLGRRHWKLMWVGDGVDAAISLCSLQHTCACSASPFILALLLQVETS